MSLRVLVNPQAGGGRAGRSLPRVRRALDRLRVPYRVQETRSLDHGRELAAAAANAGDVAVAFGGDGLIAAVAGALRDTGGVMGVLPGGRGNDFARALEIPLDPARACTVLAEGTPRALDLGVVGERTFIGIASCGVDSDANRIANQARLVRGNLVYAYGAIRALARWRPLTFTVTCDDGRPHTFSGYTVAVANARSYGGGMRFAPAADPSDGLLDVVIVGRMSRPRFLALLPTVFRGAHVRLPEVSTGRARTVHVVASRPLTLYADGEPLASLPATVTVLPGAMRVLAP